jgi:DNA-binding transcriptional MocR family regulator
MNAPHDLPALARAAGTTLAEQLAARLAERIEQRLIAPGSKLPSVRESARRHALSPSTVVAAYDRLQALGLVEARRQRGFFVREPRAPLAPARPAAPTPRRPVDATALIRGMFQRGSRPSPGMGTLPAEWLDLPLLHGALRRAMADDANTLRYGDPAGDPALREALARRLADIGVHAAPAHIVTSAGATHALDLLSRTLLEPGDAVLVDAPACGCCPCRAARTAPTSR